MPNVTVSKAAAAAVASALLAASLAGCAQPSGSQAPGAQPAASVENAAAKLPTAESGKYRKLLATMPYTAGDGCYWEEEVGDEGVLQLTKMEASDFTDEDAANRVALVDNFSFAGRREGSTSLTMKLVRSGAGALITCRYDIAVDADLNIGITGYDGPPEYRDCLGGSYA